MAVITWDNVGERFYETGVDHGVLYPYDSAQEDKSKAYGPGVAWSGLTSVSESPSGADANDLYADNIKYLTLRAAEDFGATVEAFYYPKEFAKLDGTQELASGVYIGQQSRGVFGLSYRTRKGNDTDGDERGYKLHLVYGATAAPSEKAYESVNDSPDAINFSWEINTTPVNVDIKDENGKDRYRPTAQIVIDSTEAPSDKLASLEKLLYGDAENDPYLPLPSAVYALFASTPAEGDLVSIAVTQAPSKVSYTVGEKFNPAGMTVKATLYGESDNTDEFIYPGEYTWSPRTFNATTDAVTISYTLNGIRKTTTQTVTVTQSGT